ncbi:hypothetical protein [Candidatus Bodocaedibacter vickermanii]|uniref:Uncharacterized protein n=1 Tax=Candidatus Bodocaedibacter vickermanii TaxID=2741701 RepID=A0A7L9RVN0_9PROT|nr:hypothetical protein CPBP_01229 [Candidatus Paracaedibacteraceae bacterium 'Lake Konstanz']
MKQSFLHIFLSNNLVTATHVAEHETELLFSNIHLSNLDKIVQELTPYHHVQIRLILDAPNIVIKSFDTLGMNYWHQYQLSRRLAKESESDWYALWKKHDQLIFIKGNLSELEHTFLNHLHQRRFLIESTVPALWILNTVLLSGHQIKKNGIVHFPIQDHFQQVLYLNGMPTISRITQTIDTSDWIQFVRTKYKLTLETLDADRLIKSLGKANDSFSTYALNQLPAAHAPNIIFKQGLNIKTYYTYAHMFRQFTYGMATISLLLVAALVPDLIEMNTHQLKLDTLINDELALLDKYAVNDTLTTISDAYAQKRAVVESFNTQTFPTMSFLEKLSTILPNYGQVIYIRLTPKVSSLTAAPGRDEFTMHMRIVPLKNSKNLQLLTTEIHKTFGSQVRIHIVNTPTVQANGSSEDLPLKHTVQINMTGLMHDLQRLTP